MADQHTRQAVYKLVDFWAMEHFDDPRYNTKPHRVDSPHSNGHNVQSMQKIDPSCQSPKQTLDLIADHDGRFEKEHSYVRAIEGTYHKEDGTEVLDGLHHGSMDLPFSMKLPFEDYVAMGRPEHIRVNLELKPSGL